MFADISFSPLLLPAGNDPVRCREEDLKILRFPLPALAPRLTRDGEEILRRQRMFADFDRIGPLKEAARTLCSTLGDLTALLRRTGDPSKGDNEALLYSLTELRLFTDAAEGFVRTSSGCVPESPALSRFLGEMRRLTEDGEFAALRDWLASLNLTLRNIRSLTVGINLDAQLNVREVGLVSLHDEPYTVSTPLNRFFQKQADDPALRCVAAVGIRESGSLTEHNGIAVDRAFYLAMNDAVRGTLRELRRKLTAPLVSVVRSLAERGEELAFLLSGADWIAEARAKRLPLAWPRVSPVTSAARLFPPGLADRMPVSKIVPSDVNPERGSARLAVLTGPNSGGKSAWMTAVGIAQLLFQLGLPVPAARAEMRIRSAVLVHSSALSGTGEYAGEGRLAGEAASLKSMLDGADGDSLLLFDEAFSSTSAYDAVLLSKALLNHLEKRGCAAILVTHLHELAAWIRENAPPATVSLTARIAEGRRAYEIVKDPGESAGSLAADVVRDCGLGFLLDPPDRTSGS